MIKEEKLLGSNKVIVGKSTSDLVLETLGKVYIKSGKNMKLLNNLFKLIDSTPENVCKTISTEAELQSITFPGDGVFVFAIDTKTLYIAYNKSYIKLGEEITSEGYVKRSGDIMSGQLTINTKDAPLVVTSNTLVKNLNAEYLNGYKSDVFTKRNTDENINGNWTFHGNNTVTGDWTFKNPLVKYSGSLVSTGGFASGFSGYGWKLDSATNTLTIDNLIVRKAMNVYELVVNKIRATNGSIWVSDGAKIEKVTKLVDSLTSGSISVTLPKTDHSSNITTNTTYTSVRYNYNNEEIYENISNYDNDLTLFPFFNTKQEYWNINNSTINNTQTDYLYWDLFLGDFYEIILDDENVKYCPFRTGDLLRCQKYTNNLVKYYDAIVTNVLIDKIIIRLSSIINDKYETELPSESTYSSSNLTINKLSDPNRQPDSPEVLYSTQHILAQPQEKDSLVRIGNIFNTNRQGSIYITSSDDQAPYIDILDQVVRPDYNINRYIYNSTTTTGDWFKSNKTRLGKLNGIYDPAFDSQDQPTGYGLYSENVYLTGRLIVKNNINSAGYILGEYRGEWVINTQYYLHDTVTYNGSTYTALQGHISTSENTPDNASYWKLYIKKGDEGTQGKTGPSLSYRGNYDSVKTYTINNNNRNVIKYNTTYYMSFITEEHTSAMDQFLTESNGVYTINAGSMPAGIDSVWITFQGNFESIATNLLLAENASFNIANTNTLYIGDYNSGTSGWLLNGYGFSTANYIEGASGASYTFSDGISKYVFANSGSKYFLNVNSNTPTSQALISTPAFSLYKDKAFFKGDIYSATSGEYATTDDLISLISYMSIVDKVNPTRFPNYSGLEKVIKPNLQFSKLSSEVLIIPSVIPINSAVQDDEVALFIGEGGFTSTSGGSGGTDNYNLLANKPYINGVQISSLNADSPGQNYISTLYSSDGSSSLAMTSIAQIDNTGKVLASMLPDYLLGQVLYGGNINGSSIATLTQKFKSKYGISTNTLTITSSNASTYEGVYFISTADAVSGIVYNLGVKTGDWVLSNGVNWTKVDNTDAVTGVKGDAENDYRIGNVNITYSNLGVNSVAYGGTGLSTISTGKLLIGNGANAITTNNNIYVANSILHSDLGIYTKYINLPVSPDNIPLPNSNTVVLYTGSGGFTSVSGGNGGTDDYRYLANRPTINNVALHPINSNDNVLDNSLEYLGIQAVLNGIGFVKINGTTISYDNSTYLTGITKALVEAVLIGNIESHTHNQYLTGNQVINLTGDITGSGTTSITTTIGSGKVTNAMLVKSSISINGSSVSLGDSTLIKRIYNNEGTKYATITLTNNATLYHSLNANLDTVDWRSNTLRSKTLILPSEIPTTTGTDIALYVGSGGFTSVSGGSGSGVSTWAELANKPKYNSTTVIPDNAYLDDRYFKTSGGTISNSIRVDGDITLISQGGSITFNDYQSSSLTVGDIFLGGEGSDYSIYNIFLSRSSIMSKGSATQPVYFDASGSVQPCTYSLNKTVPANAVFTDTLYTLPLASSSTRGGIQIGYTQSGRNYPVQLSSEKAFVNVPWTDTTYSAGTGISLSGTVINNSGVRSIATGTANGTISVNTNGTTANVSIYGLGSNAYTSTAYVPTTRTIAGLALSSDIGVSSLQNALGLGSNAYSSTAYLPLTGGIVENGNICINTSAGTYGLQLWDEDNNVSALMTSVNNVLKWNSNNILHAGNYTSYAVPTTRTIAGLALSSNVTTASLRTALGLGSAAYTASTAYAAASHNHTKSEISDFPSSMPASDVYSWAKASSKPSYTTSEISEGSNLYFTSARAVSACSGTYLPLAGGTMTGNLGIIETKNILLRLNNANYHSGIGYDTSGNECIALWAKNTVTRLRWHAGLDLTNLSSGSMMSITPDFEISKASGIATGYIGGKVILHSGNYNSYSPTLTGSGASGTWGINITGNASTATNLSRSILAGNGLTGGGALNADRTLTLGTPSNITATSTNSVTASSHTHNLVMGAGSGLDADLLDGLHIHSGRNNEANKVVRTDGNGYLQCGYINSSSGNENNSSNPDRVWGTNGSDSYLRTYRTSELNVNTANRLSYYDYNSSSYTVGDVKNLLRTNINYPGRCAIISESIISQWSDDTLSGYASSVYLLTNLSPYVSRSDYGKFIALSQGTSSTYLIGYNSGTMGQLEKIYTSINCNNTSTPWNCSMLNIGGSGLPTKLYAYQSYDKNQAVVRIGNGWNASFVIYDDVIISSNDVATVRIAESDGTQLGLCGGDNHCTLTSTHDFRFYTGCSTTGSVYNGAEGTLKMGLNYSGYAMYVNGTGYFTSTVTSGDKFYDSSDERLKTINCQLPITLLDIRNIPKILFNWNNHTKNDNKDKNKTYIGTIAQKLPISIKNYLINKDSDGYLSVDYDSLGVIALKGIDLLDDKTTQLENRIKYLEDKNRFLENEIKRLGGNI